MKVESQYIFLGRRATLEETIAAAFVEPIWWKWSDIYYQIDYHMIHEPPEEILTPEERAMFYQFIYYSLEERYL
jgi:hypothetical protein